MYGRPLCNTCRSGTRTLKREQRAALQKFQEAMGEVPKKEEAHKEHKRFLWNIKVI